MKHIHSEVEKDTRYIRLLAQSFPTVAKASTEIINLRAILNLPKGTEHFLADIHGEHESFRHVLKNASGNIKRKVNEIFGDELTYGEKRDLCTLIYYPEQKLELIKSSEKDMSRWYFTTIHRLVRVCRDVSSKYIGWKGNASRRLLLYHSGTATRTSRRRRQGSVCKGYHRHDNIHWQRR